MYSYTVLYCKYRVCFRSRTWFIGKKFFSSTFHILNQNCHCQFLTFRFNLRLLLSYLKCRSVNKYKDIWAMILLLYPLFFWKYNLAWGVLSPLCDHEIRSAWWAQRFDYPLLYCQKQNGFSFITLRMIYSKGCCRCLKKEIPFNAGSLMKPAVDKVSKTLWH